MGYGRYLLVLLVASAARVGAAADAATGSETGNDAAIVIVILTQGTSSYDERLAEETKDHVEKQWKGENATVLLSHRAFGAGASWGHHAVWPLVPRLVTAFPSLQWLILMEVESRMDARRLRERMRGREGEEVFEGRGLVDEQPVITHHFYGFDSDKVFLYPDFAAGVLLSGNLIRKLAAGLEKITGAQFTIDGKHEFARSVKEHTGALLQSEVNIYCQSPGSECGIWYEQKTGAVGSCIDRPVVDADSLLVAVKTFSGFHRTRVTVTKRTWARNARNVIFYSDAEEPRVPTRSLGIPNTERGHCGKTIGIIKDVLGLEETSTSDTNSCAQFSSTRWLFIADDDTIVGLTRLYRHLRCYDEKETLIIGERYGYGYDVTGENGYDYPTGGSGMLFSLSAVRLLAAECECPSADAPDDMIIGMCARRLGIPIIHAPAMHQARPVDYPRSLLNRLPPISFHKHEGVDPYEVYTQFLQEEEDEPRVDRVRQEL